MKNFLLALTLLLTAAIAPAQGFTCTVNGVDQGTCDTVAFQSLRYDYLVVVSDDDGLLDALFVPKYIYRNEPYLWTPPREPNGTVEVDADYEAGYGMCVRDCFPGCTLVRVPAGLQPIETLSAGDPVIDPATGRAVAIEQVIRSMAAQLVTFTASGKALSATRGHEFCLASGAWVAAGKLSVGDRLKTGSGEFVTVERVGTSADRRPRAVFNLRLQSGKSMLVGEHGIVTTSSRTRSGGSRARTSRPVIARGSI